MTDKDIREAAQDFIKAIEKWKITDDDNGETTGKYVLNVVRTCPSYRDLKAALKPSKEEVANYLGVMCRDGFNDRNKDINESDMDVLRHAIDYLREDK
jgi:hypothetical protein